MTQFVYTISSGEIMLRIGEKLGKLMRGGEILELSGDVGTGKTTFVKGLARGLSVSEVVQSPTFTISRMYNARDDLLLHHYDFYRLNEAGIMRAELAESLDEPLAVVALEWDETVQGMLPAARTIRLEISYIDEQARKMRITIPQPLLYILPAFEGLKS